MRSQGFDFSIPFYGCCYNGKHCHWTRLIAKITTKIADMVEQMHREWVVASWKRTSSCDKLRDNQSHFSEGIFNSFCNVSLILGEWEGTGRGSNYSLGVYWTTDLGHSRSGR